MQAAALLVLIAAGGWLIAVGVIMALRPHRALQILSLTASSQRVNLTEQVPRAIAGAALVIRAGSSKLPELFEIAGWFILASSLTLMVIPLTWHSGYAKWWATRIPPLAVRALAPLSLCFGFGLIDAAW